jgi:hypothetical protein
LNRRKAATGDERAFMGIRSVVRVRSGSDPDLSLEQVVDSVKYH